jgi:GTP-binding protein
VAAFAEERGCAMAVLLNKWDLLPDDEARERVEAQLPRQLGFVSFAPVLRTSALTGRGVDRVFTLIDTVYENYSRKITTSALNKLLTELRQFGHTVTKGPRQLRINYATQTRYKPPGFTFFANHPKLADENYKRYLENRMRETFDFTGTPIILKFRQKD